MDLIFFHKTGIYSSLFLFVVDEKQTLQDADLGQSIVFCIQQYFCMYFFVCMFDGGVPIRSGLDYYGCV